MLAHSHARTRAHWRARTRAQTHVCMCAQGGKVAVLVLNTGKNAISFDLPLSDVPKLGCGTGMCELSVRNVWEESDSSSSGSHIQIELASHETAYLTLSKRSPVQK